jgi:hypothetical protein
MAIPVNPASALPEASMPGAKECEHSGEIRQTRFKPKGIPMVAAIPVAQRPAERWRGLLLAAAIVGGIFLFSCVVAIVVTRDSQDAPPVSGQAAFRPNPRSQEEWEDEPRNRGKQANDPADRSPENSKPAQKPADQPVNKPAEKPANKSALRTEESQLFALYGRDVVAADKKYTGQVVEMASISGKVYKDSRGRYYLVAAEQARFIKSERQGARIMEIEAYINNMYESALNTKHVPGIVLYLSPSEVEKFAELNGKKVTVRGTCKGMTVDPMTEPGYYVAVENVRLVADSERIQNRPPAGQ